MFPEYPAALVTGGSRGIGRGICINLARAGFGVAINYRSNADAAEECKRLCIEAAPDAKKAKFETVRADISKPEGRARLVEYITKTQGWIDVLVNNAGAAPEVRTDLLEATEESFDRLIAINLKGPYFLTQAVANYWLSGLQSLPAERAKPRVVNISSLSAYAASVNRGDYCVSKAGLAMATQLFATRLAEYGIHVYEVRPGIIATDMTAGVQEKYDRMIAGGLTPIARWGTPEDVGRAVAAIAQGAFPFSTGEVINVDGGFHLRRL
ncbi:MAG: 3-ketoacyl-ACP reductase [Acidobacteria bacterium]|nr:MAG: 3-ketoacyl-ACP reductase [Acidobacteriota bacterium]